MTIIALIAATAVALASGETTMTFPTVSGHNLSGKAFTLPHDFEHPVNLVYIAYAREQQQDIDTWKDAADRARKAHPALGVYELPTLSLGNGLFRSFIDGGMRRGITSKAVRDVTITLYLNKRDFNDALQIRSEQAITILLVTPAGHVLWSATGPYTAESGSGLDQALIALPTK